jgi:hypothetical protein
VLLDFCHAISIDNLSLFFRRWESKTMSSSVIKRRCSSAVARFRDLICRALDTALVDDDAAIRVLSHNIDANGTGI